MSLSRPRTLRPWQQAALTRLEATEQRDFLTVATPGAGKTTFALTAMHRALCRRRARRVVVVAPTRHLKTQWSQSADGFGILLEPEWSGRDGRLPADVHGVVVTYQQVASDPALVRRLATDAFVVLDEIHHAGESRTWGESVRDAFGPAARRLGLSGTPFRSDNSAIPFVRYEDDTAVADYSYGYGDALADGGVVRPVYFPRTNGHMEWTAPDGTFHANTFEDQLKVDLANQRLRTALSLGGEWLPTVLDKAHAQLAAVRRQHPRAAGIVIAMDQEHARGIAAYMQQRFDVPVVVATSDDPDASDHIARFTHSAEPWIVAVRMVSEGVDIPRLRIGVYATHTTTDLFFRQAVGRLVRWTDGLERQSAYMFIPDDPRLRAFAGGIRRERRHHLRPSHDEAGYAPVSLSETPDHDETYGQLSLFAAISAVAYETEGLEDAGPLFGGPLPTADLTGAPSSNPTPDPAGGPAPHPLEGSLPEPEPSEQRPDLDRPRTARQRKQRLRALNHARVRELARRTGHDHAALNAELNRTIGLGRISEATAEQLEARLKAADRWLRRL